VSTRPTLSIGSTGTQVMLVQLTLDARPVDGDYGPITADAVERL
jgi:peptidoglycan hydrolase-like protein with peptidoglycan-binding domain